MNTASSRSASRDMITSASKLSQHYDAWFCDIWGVIHNGVAPFEDAVEALCRYRAAGGNVILITNAPRPSRMVYAQLERLSVPREAFDTIVTSGDITRALLMERPDAPLFHVGPERDHMILEGLPNPIVNRLDAKLCLLTGPLNDTTDTAEDYDDCLSLMLGRGIEMICANPDLVVRSRDRLVMCAGSIARRYSEMGGSVTFAGKPMAQIYDVAIAELAKLTSRDIARNRLLAIGDGLPTDIKGAAMNDIAVYFITDGIHAAEIDEMVDPDSIARLAAELEHQYPGIKLTGICDRLRWA